MHVEVLGKSCGGAATRTLVGEKVKSLLFSINCRWGRSLFVFNVDFHIKIDIFLIFFVPLSRMIYLSTMIFFKIDVFLNW